MSKHKSHPKVTVEYLDGDTPTVKVALTPEMAKKICDGHVNLNNVMRDEMRKALRFIDSKGVSDE